MVDSARRNISDADLRSRLRRSAFYVARKPVQPSNTYRRLNALQDVSLAYPKPKTFPKQTATKEFRSKSSNTFTQIRPPEIKAVVRKVETVQSEQQKQRFPKVLERQDLTHLNKVKRKLKIHKSTVMVWSVAVAIFVVGLSVSLIGLRSNHTAQAQVVQLAQKNEHSTPGDAADSSVPSEDPPKGNINAYQVGPEFPRLLTIPKSNVKSRILPLGVKANNELKTPTNIYDTGWYNGSAKPGENGAVLIDGHVSGPTSQGVFYDNKNLKPGDMIEITRGDGQSFQYRVVKSETYQVDKVDMVAALTPIEGHKGLNLITCGGKYIPAKHAYEDRIIVFATQV